MLTDLLDQYETVFDSDSNASARSNSDLNKSQRSGSDRDSGSGSDATPRAGSGSNTNTDSHSDGRSAGSRSDGRSAGSRSDGRSAGSHSDGRSAGSHSDDRSAGSHSDDQDEEAQTEETTRAAASDLITQTELTQITLADLPGPNTTVKEVGVDLRYFGGFVTLDADAKSLAEYHIKGGIVTLTTGAVRSCDVSKAKGKPVAPDCERTLCSGQQFLVQGELYSCLGLLWVGFGKIFRTRNDNKAKKPRAPLLVLVVPHSCCSLPAGDIKQFLPHLSLFTAHHVLASAVFPAVKIRRRDINKMHTVFALITSEFHKHPTFWRDMKRM